MLLQGDELYTVELFRDLVNCFQDCGRLNVSEGDGSCNEFKSQLVELRCRNRQVIPSINNGLYFLRSSGLLDCRPNLSNVIRLAELVLVPRSVEYPDVDMSMSGVKIPEKILITSVVSVQSFVSCGGFSAGELLTKDCLEELKINLPNERTFVEDASFAPWRPLYARARSEWYRGLRSTFDACYLEQVNEWRRKSGLASRPLVLLQISHSLLSRVGQSQLLLMSQALPFIRWDADRPRQCLRYPVRCPVCLSPRVVQVT